MDAPQSSFLNYEGFNVCRFPNDEGFNVCVRTFVRKKVSRLSEGAAAFRLLKRLQKPGGLSRGSWRDLPWATAASFHADTLAPATLQSQEKHARKLSQRRTQRQGRATIPARAIGPGKASK